MITPMVRVTFLGPKRHLMGVMDLLHSLGAVHLEPYPIMDQRLEYNHVPGDGEKHADLLENLKSLLEEVNRLLVALKLPSEPSKAPAWLFNHNIARKDLEGAVKQADEEITSSYSRLIELRNELALLQRYERILAALYPLLEEVVEVQHLELVGIILERKRSTILPLLEKELSRITMGRFKIFTKAMDRDNIAAIIGYPVENEGMIRSLFSEESIAEIRLPAGYEEKPLATTLRLLIKRQRELPNQITEQSQVMEHLSERWYGTLSRIHQILRERLDEFTTLPMSAHSRHTFFLRGWMPEEKMAPMFEVINSSFENEVLIEASPAQVDERSDVPVQLKNEPFVKVFEPLVRLMSLPRYGTLDPTPFMAVFFPIFFGFILGDIAYGLILLGLSLWFYRRYRHKPLIRSICAVFMFSGFFATVFGLFFGEFLGDFGEHLGLRPILMNRARLFLPLLFIAVGLGFIHIMLGFFLNMIVSLRNGYRRHWISSLASMLSLTGLMVVILSATGFLAFSNLIGISLMLLGIPLLTISEGLMGPLEFLKTFGNVLSYARLMAIGVSSVVLAEVANMIGGISGSIAMGIIVATVFHALNFALGVFSPTIHSLRLHYVEFFSKFFQPGGKPYEPFRRQSVSRI